MKVSGFGLFGNRELKKLVHMLEPADTNRSFYSASFIEDAVVIVVSRLKRDGYLNPSVSAEVTSESGDILKAQSGDADENPLPRNLRARAVRFKIKKGVLYHFEHIRFEGLDSLTGKQAQAFFIEIGAIPLLKRTRVFTPQKLERGLASLTEVLERIGYESAKAVATEERRNRQTGAVDLTIQVTEGRKSIVRSVREEVYLGPTNSAPAVTTTYPDKSYSKLWLQDFILSLKSTNYHRGYPDTSVEVTTIRRDETNDLVQVDLLAKVQTGQQITLGDVKFEGQRKTKESLLERRVRLQPREFLDRVRVEEGRYRLARLGVFESVELNYTNRDEQTRDVIYRLQEGRHIDFNLLAGWGSYELLRGGLEVEQFNVLGRAHHSRLRLIQSFKSSSSEYTYTMPELVGRDVDVFLNASALRREEVSFTREEFGGGIGVRHFFKPIDSDVSLRYNYEVLNTPDLEQAAGIGPASAGVGAIITDIHHDRRDNPLYPHEGYKVFANIELATEYLAGDVNYQRLELSGSYHHSLGSSRWLHLGASHGVALTVAGSITDLPFNRRFFPGGESSVRGYQQGEAAPRDARGKIVGAETYTAGSFEFEQGLTRAWSLVTFVDAVGFARKIEDYPFNEALFSVGAGIRWKTLIGPVRLEYGYNLNRRASDPAGTLHFSIGFPF